MDAILLAIVLFCFGVAISIGLAWLEHIDILKKQRVLVLMGIASVAFFAAGFWILLPKWYLLILVLSFVAIIWVTYVVSNSVKALFRRLKLNKIHFHWPVTFGSDTQKAAPKQLNIKKMKPQEIAERVAFLASLKLISERIDSNISGNNRDSLLLIARGIYADVRDSVEKHILASQAYRLLTKSLESFATETTSFKGEANLLTASITNGEIISLCTKVTVLLTEYRRLVKEFIIFLNGSKQAGIYAAWESEPWSRIISDELVGRFNRLISVTKDLRKNTPSNLRSVLPTEEDDRLKSFETTKEFKLA